MLYLSRTPHSAPNTSPKNLPEFTLRNSIFPISETDIFKEISIVEVPNDNDQQQIYTCNSWQWFAYLSSPTQFHSIAVPRNPSFRIQVITVLPEQFLCARSAPQSRASLCCYSCNTNVLVDVPKMLCEDRNLIGAAGALLDGWLYLAGGFQGNPSNVEPSVYLNLAERLNLKTWEWQALPPMQQPRSFATGLAHKNKFYVIGGGASSLKHSAEIYDPTKNSWQFLKSFAPKEADEFAVASINTRLLILTWSDRLGVKLWLWIELANPFLFGGWRLISFFPNQEVERLRLRQHGARMVRVGKEVWVLVGENDRVCQVDGMCAWPVFPAPMFRPSKVQEVVPKGHIYAFSFRDGVKISWRQIPVYSM